MLFFYFYNICLFNSTFQWEVMSFNFCQAYKIHYIASYKKVMPRCGSLSQSSDVSSSTRG